MIFIIIPVFNRRELTRHCLKSLDRQNYKEFKVVVVDDGSTDGTSEMIKEQFPMVQLVKGDGNLWWAGATNVGLDYVFAHMKPDNSDYILTLNNDLEVPEDYLDSLFDYASSHRKAIIGSVSVNIHDPEQINFCGISWNQFTAKYHLKSRDYGYSYSELTSKNDFVYSDMLPGRGTLIPMQVFNEIGKYDAHNFPQYAADEDFSLRARRKGWDLLIPTKAVVKSHIGETGADVENVRLRVHYFKHLFFSIKSPLNLKIRYRWAMKNTPLKFLYFFLESTRIFVSISFKVMKKAF